MFVRMMFAAHVFPLHEFRWGDLLRFRPLPGHTPGQVGLLLQGTRQTVLIAADAIHHPLQVLAPGIVSAFCADPAQAVATRAALLEEAAAEKLALIPHHARSRPLWRIARQGGGYTLHDAA